MDICKYYLELNGMNFTFNSDQELSDFVRKNMDSDEEGIKFSKIDSGLETTQEKIINNIKEGIGPYSKDFIKSFDFLREKQIIDNSFQYLSPVFIKENYKEQAILYKIENDKELKEVAKENPNEARQLAEEQVIKELELDEQMKELSAKVTSIMEGMINKVKSFDDDAVLDILKHIAQYNLHDEIKTNPKDKASLISDYVINNFTSKTREGIKKEILNWYTSLKNSNEEHIGKVYLNKQGLFNEHGGLASKINYISISPDGVSNIFEIKVSRNEFKKWHSSKIITTDYMLGVNAQLLRNVKDVKVSSMYIVPVIFPTKDGKILADSFFIDTKIDRSKYESKSGLDDGGKITNILKKLIPTKIHEDTEESLEMDQQNKEILETMFPKYNFRTKLMVKNVEKKYNDILKKYEDEPTLYLKDQIEGVTLSEENTEEGRKKFKEVVADYYERTNKHSNSRMLDVIKSIKEAQNNFSEDPNTTIRTNRTSLSFQRMFRKYLNPEWELIANRPEFINAGMLVFRNNLTNIVEVVSMTVNQLKQINDFSLGNTLLGQFSDNATWKHDTKILNASNENIEIIKALTVLNSNPKLLEGYSLNTIKVYNTMEQKGGYINLDLALYNFNLLTEHTNKFKEIENNFKGRDPKIKVTNFIESLYAEIFNSSISINNKSFRAHLSQLRDVHDLTENKEKLDYFINLRTELVSQYKELLEIDPTKIQDFSDPLQYLYYLISSGIAHYANIDSVFDYSVPKYGMSSGDWLHWVRNAMFGSAPEYDAEGNKITGLFQGQMLSTSDTSQSQYLSKIYDIINIAQNAIVSEFNKKKNIMINATKDYYKAIGRSDLEKFLIGNSDKFHEKFFESHKDKITKEFKLKNPWKDQTLETAEKDYLKFFIYFQYLSKKDANLSLDTFEKFNKSSELRTLLESNKIDQILKVPLMVRHSVLGRIKNLTTDGFHKFIGQTWDNMRTALDTRDLTGEQVDEEKQKVGAYEAINGFGRIHNIYEAQESEEYRDNLIEKHGTGHFELNLDTIALKYAYETIRQKHFSNVVPHIDAAVIIMKFYGWQSGQTKETEEALEHILDTVKLNVHNATIIDNKEVRSALGVVRSLQQVTSFMTIALRPALMMKELLVGQIKNASYAWSKIYGEDSFDGKDLRTAYSLLLKSQEDYEKIRELNTQYQIANRDLNQIVNKTKVDRFGINFFSNTLYWFNTAPDYVNRMSLFLAKMQHDGSYDAHTLDSNNNLIYDPSKDERYSLYFRKRKQYKYNFSKLDTKYNDQRSLYLNAIEEFNSELSTTGDKKLTESDNIPRAYFSKQRESIKSFTDLSYGHYDKERSPVLKHKAFGILFGQYMTFWPSKVKYYLGKEQKHTKRGYMNHKHKIVDGKKIYYYVKHTEDVNTGDMFIEEVPESELGPNDPRAKAWEWVGEPTEGLMYSLALTARSLFKGEFSEVDPQRLKNAKVALHDILMTILAILIGYHLTANYNKSKSDKTKLKQYELLAEKITYKGLNEFNPWSSIFLSLQTTPAFIDRLGQTKDSVQSLITGKSDLEKTLRKNFVFFEVLPEIPNPLARY